MAFVKDKARFVAIVVFLLDVIVLIIVLALLWSMSNKTDEGTNCEVMCLGSNCKCRTDALSEYLQQTFVKEFNLIEEQRKKKLAYEKAKKQYRLQRQFRWSIKPIARLTGSKETLREDDMDKSLMTLRNWETEGRSFCYVRNGMGYRNGRLVAPVDGLYHIYSFLDLFLEYRDKSGEMMKFKSSDAAIQHKVFKFNIVSGEEHEVLATYMPYRYSQNGRFNFYETYLSADVNLKAGDEIYLKITNVTYCQNPSKNFFGVHML